MSFRIFMTVRAGWFGRRGGGSRGDALAADCAAAFDAHLQSAALEQLEGVAEGHAADIGDGGFGNGRAVRVTMASSCLGGHVGEGGVRPAVSSRKGMPSSA